MDQTPVVSPSDPFLGNIHYRQIQRFQLFPSAAIHNSSLDKYFLPGCDSFCPYVKPPVWYFHSTLCKRFTHNFGLPWFLNIKLYDFSHFTPAVDRDNFPRQLTSGYDPTKPIPATKRGDPRSYLVRRDSVTGNLYHFPWCALGWVCAQSDERMLYTSRTHTYCEFHECRFVPEFSSRFFHLPDNATITVDCVITMQQITRFPHVFALYLLRTLLMFGNAFRNFFVHFILTRSGKRRSYLFKNVHILLRMAILLWASHTLVCLQTVFAGTCPCGITADTLAVQTNSPACTLLLQ